MHKEMRKKNREMSEEDAIKLLENGEYGVLATISEDNQPYGVPISYVVLNDFIYFHGMMSGSKMDNIKHNNKVSFTVVGKTQPKYEEESGNFTTYFESVIAFGQATIVESINEKTESLTLLCGKYLPEASDKIEAAVTKGISYTAVFKMDIEYISGKEKKA